VDDFLIKEKMGPETLFLLGIHRKCTTDTYKTMH